MFLEDYIIVTRYRKLGNPSSYKKIYSFAALNEILSKTGTYQHMFIFEKNKKSLGTLIRVGENYRILNIKTKKSILIKRTDKISYDLLKGLGIK